MSVRFCGFVLKEISPWREVAVVILICAEKAGGLLEEPDEVSTRNGIKSPCRFFLQEKVGRSLLIPLGRWFAFRRVRPAALSRLLSTSMQGATPALW